MQHLSMRRPVLLLTMMAAMLFMAASLLLTAKPAHAKTFTVNIKEDFSEGDINPGDGTCDASSTFLIPCTLRAAIEEANAFAGADTIIFNIPNVAGNEVKTIKPSKALPEITEPVTINGYTQPGAGPNTLAKGDNATLKIELNGGAAGSFAPGLLIAASNSVVKGLMVNSFGTSGILSTAGVTGIKVEGNFIGTDPTGIQDLGNDENGVFIHGDSIVGGTSPAARNVISGNNVNGVAIGIGSSGTKVQGNLIGTQSNGISPLANGGRGVVIVGHDNTIGGTISSAANTIAFNGRDGIFVPSLSSANTNGNRILRNSIHSNTFLGIDLEGGTETTSFRTLNDPGDADSGPNRLQNYPEITSATTSGTTTTIKGKLNSIPDKTFTLQFFSNLASEPAGYEGRRFLGQKSVTTNANGNVSFTFVPSKAVAVGQFVTGTATRDSTGDTSEFSFGKLVVQG